MIFRNISYYEIRQFIKHNKISVIITKKQSAIIYKTETQYILLSDKISVFSRNFVEIMQLVDNMFKETNIRLFFTIETTKNTDITVFSEDVAKEVLKKLKPKCVFIVEFTNTINDIIILLDNYLIEIHKFCEFVFYESIIKNNLYEELFMNNYKEIIKQYLIIIPEVK